ncbi:MAG: DUF2934 domain-containing protein, partial [Sulfuricellaceae bacterium]|nr:DUF2934 domain-containing protein [Sulfuricellaceae bacterium]
TAAKPAAKTTAAKTSSAAKKSPVAKSATVAKPAAAKKSPPAQKRTGAVSSEQRAFMIAEAAYFMAEKRNFEGGYAWHDWLAAEAEVDRMLGLRK